MQGILNNQELNTEVDTEPEWPMEVCPQLQRNYHSNLLAQKIFLFSIQQGTHLHSNFADFALIVRNLKKDTPKTGEGTSAFSFGLEACF